MWNADRTMYYGTRVPDAFERIELEAQARLRWLLVETKQNLRRIMELEKNNENRPRSPRRP